MNNEKKPSLFVPLVAAVLFLFVVLSGITEVACLASYASKSNEQSKATNKTQQLAESNAKKMLSSVSMVNVLSK